MIRRVCNRVLSIVLAAALAMTPAMTSYAAQEDEQLLREADDLDQDKDDTDKEYKEETTPAPAYDDDAKNDGEEKEEKDQIEETVEEASEEEETEEVAEEEEGFEGSSKLMSEGQEGTTPAEGARSGVLENGMTWELDNGKLTIKVSDDDSIKNRTVIPDFFYLGTPLPKWHDYASEITEIELDERITVIGLYAFRDTNITEITIPKNVQKTMGGAFENCKNLSKIIMKSKNAGLYRTYYGCNISEVVFPEGIDEIPNALFDDATFAPGFTMVIPKTVKRIGQSAFAAPTDFTGEGGIEGIVFEEGSQLEEIDNWAFLYTNIRKIEFPSTLKRIGVQAFCRTALEDVVIPEGVEQIDSYAFVWMKNLKTITMPSSVKYMGYLDNEGYELGDEFIGETTNDKVVSNADCSVIKYFAEKDSLAWRYAVKYNGVDGCNYVIPNAAGISNNAYLVFFNANGGEDGEMVKGASSYEDSIRDRFDYYYCRKTISNYDDVTLTSPDGYLQLLYSDDSFALSGSEFVKPGYTLTGWKGSNGKNYPANAVLKGIGKNNEVLALTAQWSPANYAIKYNNNGGTIKKGVSAPVKFTATDNGFDLPSASDITKPGYTFEGWYNNPAFEGEKITHVDLTVFDNPTLNLYAKWEKNGYTVTFDKNASDAVLTEGEEDSVSLDYDESLVLSKALFKRNGYTLASWNTLPDGKGKKYASTATVKNLMTGASENDSITLYAQWTVDSYKITYDLKGGKQSGAPASYKTNTGASLKVPTKTGYKFLGWESDNANVVVSGSNTIEKDAGNYGNVKLTAKWEAIRYSVIVKGDGAVSDVPAGQFSYDEEIDMQDGIAELYAGIYDAEYLKTNTIDYFTTKPGSGTKYSAYKTYRNLSAEDGATVVLYPHWGIKTYRIVYEADFGNGAEGISLSNITNLAKMPASYDGTKNAKLVAPKTNGFVFDGYEIKPLREGDGSDINWLVDKKGNPTEISKLSNGDVKITLKFHPVEYSVVVNPNAKDVRNASTGKKAENITIDNIAFVGGNTAAQVTKTTFERDGYEFVGFNTKATGKGSALSCDENGVYNLAGLSQKAGKVNIYAIWKGVDYSISYYESVNNAYDHVSDYSQLPQMAVDAKTNKNPTAGIGGKEIKFNNPVKTGYAFTGWTLVPASDTEQGVQYFTKKGSDVIAGIAFTNIDDVAAIANFVPVSYKLTISSNSGNIKSTNKAGNVQLGSYSYETDAKAEIALALDQFTRKGYAFAGFATDAKGKNMIMDENGVLCGSFEDAGKVTGLGTKKDQDVKIYAVWEKIVAEKPVITTAALQDGTLSVDYKAGKSAAKTSYEVQYSSSMLFRNAVSKECNSTSAVIDGINSGKAYYVRVRQIKKDSQGNDVKGSWSKTVRVR